MKKIKIFSGLPSLARIGKIEKFINKEDITILNISMASMGIIIIYEINTK